MSRLMYQCDFCYHTRETIEEITEHEQQCPYNPACKTCKTCRYFYEDTFCELSTEAVIVDEVCYEGVVCKLWRCR